MIFIAQGGVSRIAPGLGIEMQAEDEIRTDIIVDELRPTADLGDSVEKEFRFLLECARRLRLFLIGERGLCGSLQAIWSEAGIRSIIRAGEGDLGPEIAQSCGEELADEEGHVALGDGFRSADLKPPFFHFGPFPAEMAGVDCDVQSGQWLALGMGR